ncbi:MAG: hypothetical protein Q8L99_08430 [Polycyclovorans sp.]|jgi:hypothetical protein|nr:hypothetical protein [Polycyclovorans sp.]
MNTKTRRLMQGAASVFAPSFNPDMFRTQPRPSSDAAALQGDWERIGGDFRKAVEHERRKTAPESTG